MISITQYIQTARKTRNYRFLKK